MLKTMIFRTVDFCAHRAVMVVLAALLIAAAASVYAVKKFAITTDVAKLISTENSSVQTNTKAFQAAFPQRKIVAVVEAATPESAQQAADRLTGALRARSSVFASVEQLAGGEFFQRRCPPQSEPPLLF